MHPHARITAFRAATIAAVAAIVLGGTALAAPKNGDELLKDEVHRLQQAKTSFSGGNKGGSAWNIDVVGHDDLGGRGFNGDVWTHDGFRRRGSLGLH